jgi:heme-degrading monooxygenase HmoA
MALCLVLHRVQDFDAWRRVYDSVAQLQKDGGVGAESVHRMADDPDNVLVVHEFDSLDHARRFFADPQLRDAMQRGGVIGEPRIEFFD